MSGIMDRLGALGRGAAQGASLGFVDELYPKILDALPKQDDGTDIQREYAAGSAENDYKQNYRAADADAAAKFPANFGAGALLGAAPAAIATGGLGIPGAVGMGAIQGAGSAEDGSKLRGAVKGGALGGALGAAGNALQAAAPAAKAAMSKLMQGPPPSGGLAPAMAEARAGTSAARPAPVPNTNFSRSANLPPRPNTSDLAEVMPESYEQRAIRAIEDRPSIPPAPAEVPKPAKIPQFDEKDLAETEARLRQTEESWAKKHAARFDPKAKAATVRPPKGRKADKPAPLALVPKQAPALAPAPAMASMDRPLVGPKQLSDDRILELARAGREANPVAPSPAAGLSPEQLEQGKQMLREQFKKMSGDGNVVSLDDGAIQVADDPVIAGRVREFQQHAKAAEAAGDADQAQWFRDQIEQMLTGS